MGAAGGGAKDALSGHHWGHLRIRVLGFAVADVRRICERAARPALRFRLLHARRGGNEPPSAHRRAGSVCAAARRDALTVSEGSAGPVARREAPAQWAVGPTAQSDSQRVSETIRATVRAARMIEQPGSPHTLSAT